MRLLEPRMDTLRPQIGPYRIGTGPLNPVISLFSQSVDSGRRQYLIFGVENGHPRFGARGEISPFSVPFCAPLQLSQTAFSFATDKRPENILDPKRSSQVSRGYAYIQRVHSGMQRERTLISAERSA